MRRILNIWILLLVSMLAWSQGTGVATDMPYECGFEESENLNAWVLNYGTPNATDQWVIGSAAHSAGKRSLYITSDGANPTYGRKKNVVVSYLRYKFPTASGTKYYDVNFDWKGMGDSALSKLYVMACPEAALSQTGAYNLNAIITAPNARLSTQQLGACQNLGESGEKFVCGSERWQNVSFSRPVGVSSRNSQNNYVFVFIWVNENSDVRDTISKSSIAIDNFQINTNAITKPSNLEVYPQCEDSTLLVTWQSQMQGFDLEYRATGTSTWNKIWGLTSGVDGFTRTGSSDCSYVIKRVLEGTYDVRVRSYFYDDETNEMLRSNYVYESQILVYCPDNHCINYIRLDGPNVVCTYGEHEKHTGHTPFDNVGIIDYGPDSENSRHTVHKDPTELDPRADSLLHCVPPGALASVRLGNWNASGKAQSITYTFTVDTTSQGILIMKYAAVLDNSGHGRDEEPYFRVEILDSLNNPMGNSCGKADFAYSDAVSAQDLESWHITRYQGNELAWKDWTTVGVDLTDYHGQTIKVRITTADCGQTIHYGYGYFTLDCANAHIETNNCGNDASITCKAPDGFAYEWYNELGQLVSNDQELSVDASRQTYTCRVSFVEDPSCYFELHTLSAPRFPVPEYTFERIYEECRSKLKFTNTSHVMNKFEGYENHTSEPCTDWFWRFRRLSDNVVVERSARDLTFDCPQTGDSIEVALTTYIGADNACDSTRVDTIVVPNIIPENTEFYDTICHESPIKFDNKWFDEDTVYVSSYTNFAGCDSTSTLHLKVYPQPKDVYIHDSICSDQFVRINGVDYNQPLDNYLILMQTTHGCDSALYLTLTVNERIKANVEDVPFLCADDEQLYLTLNITAGEYDSLGIVFNTPTLRDTMIYTPNLSEVSIPYPDTITPGVYQAEITFYQFCCGPFTQKRNLEIRYRSSIVEQKWNDVLTVLSPKYNGGMEFTAFQWYKDDQPLAGETHSYLYQPLDFESVYYVELTRADGVVMTTCPIQPTYHEQQSKYPTIVPAGQHVPMYMDYATTIWYYTMSGQLYRTFDLPQGYTSLPVPTESGAFVIKAVNAQGETQAQVMIVQ